MPARRTNVDIKLTDEQKKALEAAIDGFYLEVSEDKPDLIERAQILRLFMERLAPIVYNRALDDALWWFKQTLDNVEADYGVLYKNE